MPRRFCFLLVLGFFLLVVAGPVLAILTVLVPLALIGFVLWAAFCGACSGRLPNPQQMRSWCCRKRERLRRVLLPRLFRGGQDILERLQILGKLALAALAETLSGAILGGYLLQVSQREHCQQPFAVASGVLIGGLFGLLVFIWGRRPALALELAPAGPGRPAAPGAPRGFARAAAGSGRRP